jgi:dsRNA-specific ribonuclease
MVVEHLYDKYDRGLDEGTLSLLKQAGVSNKSLGLIAVKFNLHELTLMDIP